MEFWKLKILPQKVYRPGVAGPHYFDEEQEPDPPYQSESWIGIRIDVERWISIQIRIKGTVAWDGFLA